MKRAIISCLFILVLSVIAYGAQKTKIELTDGSIIEAEVVSLSGGVYTLNTDSLGQIKIDASKIKKLSTLNTGAMPSVNLSDISNTAVKSQIDTMKTAMVNDPQTMEIIAGLLVDPQFQELLKDPEIVNALNSGNIQALMSNAKFMSITSHPKLGEIRNKLKE